MSAARGPSTLKLSLCLCLCLGLMRLGMGRRYVGEAGRWILKCSSRVSGELPNSEEHGHIRQQVYGPARAICGTPDLGSVLSAPR